MHKLFTLLCLLPAIAQADAQECVLGLVDLNDTTAYIVRTNQTGFPVIGQRKDPSAGDKLKLKRALGACRGYIDAYLWQGNGTLENPQAACGPAGRSWHCERTGIRGLKLGLIEGTERKD